MQFHHLVLGPVVVLEEDKARGVTKVRDHEGKELWVMSERIFERKAMENCERRNK